MMYLLDALADCVGGGHILTPTKTCVICHGLFILAAALDVVRRHTNKKKPTHYSPLVSHAASASTSPMMVAAALGSPNV